MNLLIIGFDGYAKSVIDSAMELNCFDSIAVLDDERIGESFGIANVVDGIEKMGDYLEQGFNNVFIANESDLKWRLWVCDKAKALGFEFATIIDKSAQVAPDATIGAGSYVGKGCVVGPGSSIGENVILDTGAIVQSDCKVGALSRICTRGILSEESKVGYMCYVGVHSIITERTVVEDYSTVEDVTVYGKQFFEE